MPRRKATAAAAPPSRLGSQQSSPERLGQAKLVAAYSLVGEDSEDI